MLCSRCEAFEICTILLYRIRVFQDFGRVDCEYHVSMPETDQVKIWTFDSYASDPRKVGSWTLHLSRVVAVLPGLWREASMRKRDRPW